MPAADASASRPRTAAANDVSSRAALERAVGEARAVLAKRASQPDASPDTRRTARGLDLLASALRVPGTSLHDALARSFHAGSARDVGRNVGGLLKEWAGWLFGGVTAIVAIPYLARRDVAGGLVFTLIALIVGGFVLAGPTVAQIIESIYKLAAEGK